MNYLFHSYLSGNDKDIILGGFIADGVKGNQILNYKASIINGIQLHRKIDEFSHTHPAFISSRRRLDTKYAAVMVDMFYDHFLSANWNQYSTIPLKNYTADIYKYALQHYTILPLKIKKLLPFMMSSDWLSAYGRLEDLQNFFEGLAKRAQFKSGMEFAVIALKKEYHQYKKEFEDFILDVKQFSEKQLLQ